VLTNQLHAPGEGFTAAPGNTTVDEGIEQGPFVEAEPRHGRNRQVGKYGAGFATTCPPRHLPVERSLRFVRNLHSLWPGIFSKTLDSAPLGDPEVIRVESFGRWAGQRTDYEDFIPVTTHRKLLKPSFRKPSNKPGFDIVHDRSSVYVEM
jgi:hypothetical protein